MPGPQGRSELLGVQVAAALEELALDRRDSAGGAYRVILLAGDLYSVPAANKRGGYGDVADVWIAFVERFAWVAGVAGNHDDVSGVAKLGARVHLLDGELAEPDGLRIGGVGGIIGNPRKPGRRSEADQLRAIDRAIDHGLDILILHEGPYGGDKQPGNDAIRATIEAGEVGLTICGHDHWRVAACHPRQRADPQRRRPRGRAGRSHALTVAVVATSGFGRRAVRRRGGFGRRAVMPTSWWSGRTAPGRSAGCRRRSPRSRGW